MHLNNFFLEYQWFTNPVVRLVLFFICAGVVFTVFQVVNYIKNSMNEKAYVKEYSRLNYEQSIRDKVVAHQLQSKRPPVLYLRPFTLDGSKTMETVQPVTTTRIKGITFGKGVDPVINKSIKLNAELDLARKTNPIGPFVAIGNSKKIELNIGASRFYYSNEEWQHHASELMESAAMIVMRIEGAISRGLNWEIDQVVEHYLAKTVFYIHIKQAEVYEKFRLIMQAHGLNFPVADDLELYREIYFSFRHQNLFSYSYDLRTNLVFIREFLKSSSAKDN